MIRTVLIDDEPRGRQTLRNQIERYCKDLEIVAEADGVETGIATILREKPDVVFLDIQMPGMNGFEVVKTLQSDIMPMAIFVTAFNQYAVDAFDLHAVDYVLKPLDEERIRRSVDRALDRLKSQSDTNFKTPLIGAIDAISKRMAANKPGDSRSESLPDGMKRKLLVRDSGVVKVIPFDDIDWVDAAGDYMCVHAAGETHVIRSTLRELKAKLDDKLFVQIHRSTIVNVERVVSVAPLQKGGSLLHLSDGGSLKVSRNYRESIRNLFQ